MCIRDRLADWLNAALADTSAIAQLVGAFDPRAAIVPAAIRATRDAAGILGNAAELVGGESETDRSRKIIEEEKKAGGKVTKERTAQAKTLAQELEGMPAEARARRLATLDRDTRAAVESRLRRRELSETERGLAALPVDRRAAAVRRILAGMEEPKRAPFLDRLRTAGILTRETEAELDAPAQ